MSTKITKTETTSIASIEIPESHIAKGLLTFDLHQTNSQLDQALFECFDDMLLSGTTTHTRGELLDAINSLGSGITINIVDGQMTLEISGTDQAWPKTVRLTQSILTNSVFPASELKRVKQLAINELRDQIEDAGLQSKLKLKSELFAKNDRRAVIPEKELEQGISELKVQDFKNLQARLQTANIVASVTGSSKACAIFTKMVSAIAPQQAVTEVVTAETTTKPKRLVTTNIPSRENIDLSIGCTVDVRPGHEDYVPLSFGISVLCKWGGFSGRMMSIVREKEGLTYSIYGRIEGFTSNQNGYFRLYTFFNPGQLEQGITSTFREFNTIQKNGITKQEHTSFKSILATQTTLQNDSPTVRIRVLHEYNKLGCTLEQIEAIKEDIQNVSVEEVNTVLKKHLDPKRLVISAAGPTDKVKKELTALSKKI